MSVEESLANLNYYFKNTSNNEHCYSDMQFINLLVKLLHKGHNTVYTYINLSLYTNH